MTGALELPTAVAVLISVLVVVGAVLALIGSIGLLRLRSFYERVHPPTMGTTLGLGFTLLASMLLFTTLASRPIVNEVLIGLFMIVTTPVSFMMLVAAALHRDRAEGRDPVTRSE